MDRDGEQFLFSCLQFGPAFFLCCRYSPPLVFPLGNPWRTTCRCFILQSAGSCGVGFGFVVWPYRARHVSLATADSSVAATESLVSPVEKPSVEEV